MVFCNNCGEVVAKEAKFCQNCGNETSDMSDIQDMNENKSDQKLKKKSPATAAAINLIIAGLGFVYIKEYAKAILSFVFVVIVAIISGYGSILALLLVILWTYSETTKYNEKLE